MRKMHYNEGLNIKLARQLIASELEEDEDADEEMRDATEETQEDAEETEEISVDPPQEGEQLLLTLLSQLLFCAHLWFIHSQRHTSRSITIVTTMPIL